MTRRFFVLLVVLSFTVNLPSAAAQTSAPHGGGYPAPEECQTEPRTEAELAEILTRLGASMDADALQAASEVTELPAGEHATPETVAAIAPVARAYIACISAQDAARWFALFTDKAVAELLVIGGITADQIGEVLAPAETPVSDGDTASEPVFLGGVFHARTLTDGRVIAVVPNDAFAFSVLWFKQEGDQWRIDGLADPAEDSRGFGLLGNTFTSLGSDFDVGLATAHDGGEVVRWSYGIAWDDPWQVVKTYPEALSLWTSYWGSNGDIELTNGTSSLFFHAREMKGGNGTCTTESNDVPYAYLGQLAADLGLETSTTANNVTEATLAVDPSGQPIQGQEDGHSWNAYDVPVFPDGERISGPTGTPLPVRFWLDCRTISRGVASLLVLQIVPVADYDSEVAARDALLEAFQG